MSFQSTQNLNPTYDLLSATSIQTNDLVTNTFTATTFDATTIVTTTVDATTLDATTITATGVITGATVDATTVNATNVNATGVITGATVDATTVNATNVNATGIVTGVSVNGTTVNATTVVATTVDCTTCAPDNLSLIAPITTSNATLPAIGQLGYLVVQANTVDVPLTTTLQSTVVVTPANIPIGVYQVNARVQLSIDAGVTIDSLQIQIETTGGTIAGEINNNPVTYASASQYTTTQSVCYFNQNAQIVSITVTAQFAGGTITVQTGNAKLSLVRIA